VLHKVVRELVFHDKSKNIEIKYQYIRDMVEKGAMKLQYVATDEQVVDVLTKSLSKVKFEYFRDKLGVVPRKRGVMIYRLNSGDSEHDRVGQQWVVIYKHEISSSSVKKSWFRWRCVVFMYNMKKGWL
jgi:vacuolar-type H+-ATPase subunit E/Vma4